MVSPWSQSADDVLRDLGSRASGLTAAEAQQRLADLPPDGEHRTPAWLTTLVTQFSSPVVVILVAATVLSMVVGDVTDGAIIIGIILASGLLGFWQDHRAGRDIAALMARVQVTVDVRRDGVVVELPRPEVVPGDVVLLGAGSLIPADCRLLTAVDLMVDESALTGESFPAEKSADALPDAAAPLAKRPDVVYFGTHVVSGTADAVAYACGRDTELGGVSRALQQKGRRTSYEQGITRFGYLLVRLMIVLTAFIFVVNAAFGRSLMESLLFSLALAVGLTPQMLPAIVTISLSAGARLLAERKVIVKRLDVIEDLGTMTVLCTDKTGTLTAGAPALDAALALDGSESAEILRLAVLNAGLQTGFVNPMDAAILERAPLPAGSTALGQVSYDFSRKRLSVLTDVDGAPTLVVKGAYDNVLGCCAIAADARAELDARFEQLSADGYRVLALATRPFTDDPETLSPASEAGLTLAGLLAFHDPVKPGVADTIRELEDAGVSLRLITGDNRLAARAIGGDVGLRLDRILTGSEIDGLSDEALAAAAREVQVYAEVEPHHKRRIVRAVQAGGVGTGFLGDGINDAPALRAADVGISVDTAVDVARGAAAVVLLDKNLEVVLDGIRTGRRTFANTLKYARLTTSANFGNMLSMAAASLLLPFLPLLPRQILLLNFLTDLPSTAIASDAVDPEQLARPARWEIREIARFMVVFGALSTVFDLATFAVLAWWLDAGATEFRSAWFIESSVTELLVVFSLRTTRPMWRSPAGRLLLGLSLATIVVIVAIPHVPLVAHPFGFDAVPTRLLLAVLALTVAYVGANELVKPWFYRRVAASARGGTPGR